MHKTQVEEMHEFFSQKKTCEEVSAILQARHPPIRGYSIKSVKCFCQKKWNFSQDLFKPCASNDF